MEIVYCVVCGQKLLASDFVRGRAYNRGDKHYCVKCRPLEAAPAPAPKSLPPTTPRRPQSVPASRSKLPIVLGAAGAAVLLIVVVIGVSGRPAPTADTRELDALRETAARDKSKAEDVDRLIARVAEIRKSDPGFARKDEILALLKPGQPVVDALRAEYLGSFDRAAADAAKLARAEAEGLAAQGKLKEAVARLDALPKVFPPTEELKKLREQFLRREAESNGPLTDWVVKSSTKDDRPGILKEHLGKPDVIITHPLTGEEPATLTRELRVPKAASVILEFTVTTKPPGDWELRVSVDGVRVMADTVSWNAWKKIRVDLSLYAGKTVKIQLENAANGWNFEHAYWAGFALRTDDPTMDWQQTRRRQHDIWGSWHVESSRASGMPVLLDTFYGKPHVLRTLPFSKERPATLEREFTLPAGATEFMVWVGHLQEKDWEFRLFIDDQLKSKHLISGETRWRQLTENVSAYAGKTVKIRLENAANDWDGEYGYWGDPRIK